eukprot:GHVU01204571.1.p1 GENE.GHVU01204571.1~~GHVU01204571.1.p1  ORF type:complete len:467 (+),score=98.20 GHVU01204571.1:1472-2872(+)
MRVPAIHCGWVDGRLLQRPWDRELVNVLRVYWAILSASLSSSDPPQCVLSSEDFFDFLVQFGGGDEQAKDRSTRKFGLTEHSVQQLEAEALRSLCCYAAALDSYGETKRLATRSVDSGSDNDVNDRSGRGGGRDVPYVLAELCCATLQHSFTEVLLILTEGCRASRAFVQAVADVRVVDDVVAAWRARLPAGTLTSSTVKTTPSLPSSAHATNFRLADARKWLLPIFEFVCSACEASAAAREQLHEADGIETFAATLGLLAGCSETLGCALEEAVLAGVLCAWVVVVGHPEIETTFVAAGGIDRLLSLLKGPVAGRSGILACLADMSESQSVMDKLIGWNPSSSSSSSSSSFSTSGNPAVVGLLCELWSEMTPVDLETAARTAAEGASRTTAAVNGGSPFVSSPSCFSSSPDMVTAEGSRSRAADQNPAATADDALALPPPGGGGSGGGDEINCVSLVDSQLREYG